MSEATTAPALPSLTFIVRGQPLGQNAAWRIAHQFMKGGVKGPASLRLSAEGIAFKLEVARIAALVVPRDWDRENEYAVTCAYYFVSRRSDVDGPGKLVLDALGEFDLEVKRKHKVHFTGFWRNDRQVWRFVQQREKDAENPRVEITIRMRRMPAAQLEQPRQGALL